MDLVAVFLVKFYTEKKIVLLLIKVKCLILLFYFSQSETIREFAFYAGSSCETLGRPSRAKSTNSNPRARPMMALRSSQAATNLTYPR